MKKSLTKDVEEVLEKEPSTLAEKRQWVIDTLFVTLFNAQQQPSVDMQQLRDLGVVCLQVLHALKESTDSEEKSASGTNDQAPVITAQELALQISLVYRLLQDGKLSNLEAMQRMELLSLMVKTLRELPEAVEVVQDTSAFREPIQRLLTRIESSLRIVRAWEEASINARSKNVLTLLQLKWLANEVYRLAPTDEQALGFLNLVNEVAQKKAQPPEKPERQYKHEDDDQ